MEEQLISFDTAKLAKSKGFTMFKESFKSALVDSRNHDVQRYSFYRVIRDEMSLNLNVGTNSSQINGLWESYNDDSFVVQKNYFAPTQSLLQKWLREAHSIIVEIEFYDYKNWNYTVLNPSIKKQSSPEFRVYEQALEEGLQEALMLIKID